MVRGLLPSLRRDYATGLCGIAYKFIARFTNLPRLSVTSRRHLSRHSSMFQHYWPHILFFADLVVRLIMSIRIVQRRPPVGVAWAWLSLLFFIPFGGTVLYLFLGESRLGPDRRRKIQSIYDQIWKLMRAQGKNPFLQTEFNEEPAQSISRVASSLFDIRPLRNNEIELLDGADPAFPRMIHDIDEARESIDMEFFIWSDGGRADEFGEALIRAAKRGVRVRVLVDRIGSSGFLKGPMCRRLHASGVEVREALPSGFFRSFISRPDLRVHRKNLVIDRAIGYTGSLNLADPIFFKREAGVGQWVDALCRVRGPVVRHLHLVFLSDWNAESAITPQMDLDHYPLPESTPPDSAIIQVLPSGPTLESTPIEELLISAISSAREEVVMTTPYFVPNESLQYALSSAARRGVKVILISPEKVDSRVTQYAARGYFKDLIAAGVHVALYRKGLLHTKSVVIDRSVTLFGSLNLDPRSLRINFEITIAVYDQLFAKKVREMQERYLADSLTFDVTALKEQSAFTAFLQNLARLAGPLL